MIASWDSLSNRDRIAVILGSICAVCFLLYSLIFSPILTARHTKTLRLEEQQATLAWMIQQRAVGASSKSATSVTLSQLFSVISTELKEDPFKNYPNELQQMHQNALEVHFKAVPYTAVLQWLWLLHQRYIITINVMNIQKTATPGVVTFSVTLKTA